jgi:ABC-type multidrug transport system fused ATPase/permease subunit
MDCFFNLSISKLPHQEAIEAAARQANAYDFITGFEDGFETLVGERGAHWAQIS